MKRQLFAFVLIQPHSILKLFVNARTKFQPIAASVNDSLTSSTAYVLCCGRSEGRSVRQPGPSSSVTGFWNLKTKRKFSWITWPSVLPRAHCYWVRLITPLSNIYIGSFLLTARYSHPSFRWLSLSTYHSTRYPQLRGLYVLPWGLWDLILVHELETFKIGPCLFRDEVLPSKYHSEWGSSMYSQIFPHSIVYFHSTHY